MNKETAEEVLAIASECSRKADESARLVKDGCDERTFKLYARHVGRIMGNIFTELLSPVYEEHPELAPDWYNAGQRDDGLGVALQISDPMRRELLSVMDEIYNKIESVALILRARPDAVEANLYLSRVHEVLLHVAAAKAHLLSFGTKGDEGEQ